MSIVKEHFGNLPDGRAVTRFVLENEQGAKAAILDYAGAIQALFVPDRDGALVDVVGGFETAEQYYYGNGNQGSLIGRFGNRIKHGRFTLDGKTYTLAINNHSNHLHGGPNGFARQMFDAMPVDGAEPSLRLSYVSPDGEEGYPGTLCVNVTYTLTRDNALSIHYVAMTDAPSLWAVS